MCVSGYCVGESYFFFLLVFFAFFAFFAFLAILPSVIPKLVQCKSTSTSIRAEYTMIEKLISKASKKVNGGHALRRHEPVTYAIVLKILDGTLKLADKFFLLHPEIKKQPKVHEVPHLHLSLRTLRVSARITLARPGRRAGSLGRKDAKRRY
jgi:hypothetical protein